MPVKIEVTLSHLLAAGVIAVVVTQVKVPGFKPIAQSSPNIPPTSVAPSSTPTPTPQQDTGGEPKLGVWVASVGNIDFPSKPGLSAEVQMAELQAIVARVKSLGIKEIYFQIRPAGDALYASELDPWSHVLTGQQGLSPGYDPLEYLIEIAKPEKIEIHAWANPYRAQAEKSPALASSHLAERIPDSAYQYGDLLWFDPGQKWVQDHTYEVLMDVVRRYDVDGIHLDDYFYPYPKKGVPFPDSRTYAAYKMYGGKLSLADWRRDNVNKLVKRVSEGIRAENAKKRAGKPRVKFSISPFGIYRPGQPKGIVGLDQYNELYADPVLWLKEGWLDINIPQLYWKKGGDQAFEKLLPYWKGVSGSADLCVGLPVWQVTTGKFTVGDIQDQIKEAQSHDVNCFTLFRYKHLLDPRVEKLIRGIKKVE